MGGRCVDGSVDGSVDGTREPQRRGPVAELEEEGRGGVADGPCGFERPERLAEAQHATTVSRARGVDLKAQIVR